VVAPHIRTVTTASGARAVQIVYSNRKGARDIKHIGSAHDDVEFELLKTIARQTLAGGQDELDLGLQPPPQAGGPLPVTSSRMGHLWDALSSAYDVLGFGAASGGDEVFRHLVLARIIEPTSKFDSLRVLAEAGIETVSYPTITRRLRVYSAEGWREQLAAACARHANLGRATLVLYDVTTLYFETHEGDGFRESGFSKERRIEPQITVGLLTDAAGFPLMVGAFEGNRAETTTMLPTLKAFMTAHHLPDVVIVADAGMISDANKRAIEAEGLSFILGAKTPEVPYQIDKWHREHPGEPIPDGHIFTQPWPAQPSDKRRDQVFYYQYSHDRGRRTLHGIDEQVRKAEDAVAGRTAIKRNRFVQLTGATKAVNRDLEAKARALAGIKGYVTNIANPNPEMVIGAYRRLLQIEKSFRMAKSDLAARPIYARTRDSIEAHLTIVFAAIAVGRWIEETTGWSLKKFVKTARRYRTYEISLGNHTIKAADPLPDDLHAVLEAIKARAAGH
jgi:hypothetical protein